MPDDGLQKPVTVAPRHLVEAHAPGGTVDARAAPTRKPAAQRAAAPRRLGLFAVVAVLAAAAAAAYGILSRDSAEATLSTWTNQQAVPTVEVAPPDQSTTSRSLVLPGDVEAFYEAPIYARVNGYLKSWSVDIGAQVRKGQLLGVIETPDLDQELVQAEADLATARANGALASLTAKRWHALLASNSVSVQSADEKAGNAAAQQSIVSAQQARVSQVMALESFKRLTAPFDGVVTARSTDVGALIASGSSAAIPLFKVADMHQMRVYVRVPQSYASQLAIGMMATLRQPQYPGIAFPATLATTSQSVARDSRTMLVELMAANPDGKLWAGTYAEVDFSLPADSQLLRVPSSALIFRSQGAQLATVTPQNTIAMKDVTIGRNLGSEIEIERGIAPTDRIVTTPLDTIEAGERVQVAQPAAGGAKPTATAPPGAD